MICGIPTVKLKYLALFLNIVLTLLGLALVIVGAIVYEDSLETQRTSIGLIVAGSVMFVIACCGFCGIVAENVCCMGTYIAFLIILAIMAIHSLCQSIGGIDDQIVDDINAFWKAYMDGDMQKMIKIQEQLHCCGKNGPIDYVIAGKDIPASCYENKEAVTSKLYKTGCYKKAKESVGNFLLLMQAISWATLIFEIAAAIVGILYVISFRYE